METVDIRYERFQCQKVKRQVIVNSIVLPTAQVGAVDAAASQGLAFDCDQKTECGVLTETDGQRRVDWSRCTCSDLKNHLPPQIKRTGPPTGSAAALQSYYALMMKPKIGSGSQNSPPSNPKAATPAEY